MKVAHFHFGKDGGAERFFVRLCNSLARNDVEQVSFIRPERAWRSDIESSTQIIESHFRNLSLDKLLLPLRVRRLEADWQPDAILAWMPKGAKLMPAKAKALRIARLGDYPLRLTYFRNIDILVCNTPGIAERVRQLGWQREVTVISNFIDTELVKPAARSQTDTPEEAFVVSTMGRFVPRKGFDVLINAIAQTKDIYLWIMGDGQLAGELRQLVKDKGVVDRVKFLGWQKDTARFVRASDALAMASSHEPLGNVALEGWGQQVPVISTRSEGPSWFMCDGQNGLMVDIGDAEGFATAFERLRTSPALGKKLVAGANRTLSEKFSRKTITKAYIDLFSGKQAGQRW